MNGLKPLLHNVGRAHVRFAARDFKPEYWNVFHSALKAALAGHIAAVTTLTEEDRVEAVEAWHRLSDFIVYQMRRGYLDGLTEAGNIETSSL
jgi:hypothetical protein